MISVEEAKNLIIENSHRLSTVIQSVSESWNYIVAEDIISPISYPPFNQSAMDGYAFRFSDYQQKNELRLIGEAPAGQPFKGVMNGGATVRVFTGGMIPVEADTVVMQEHISSLGQVIKIQNENIFEGANIRLKGSVIKKGDIVMKSGMKVNPAAIGFLHSLGVTQIKVCKRPKVSILVTGDELIQPGLDLEEGKVYESNSSMLLSAINSVGINVQEITSSGDNKNQLLKRLTHLTGNSDVVFISGGVSVGDYDYVTECLTSLGADKIFHKVAQKPGKPFYFGKKDNCLVFGLPGNPASALTCFYEFGLTAIKKMQGEENVFLKTVRLPISKAISKKPGLALFLKAKIEPQHVVVADQQVSNDLGTFAISDCLVYIPADKEDVKTGESVEVHLIP